MTVFASDECNYLALHYTEVRKKKEKKNSPHWTKYTITTPAHNLPTYLPTCLPNMPYIDTYKPNTDTDLTRQEQYKTPKKANKK